MNNFFANITDNKGEGVILREPGIFQYNFYYYLFHYIISFFLTCVISPESLYVTERSQSFLKLKVFTIIFILYFIALIYWWITGNTRPRSTCCETK